MSKGYQLVNSNGSITINAAYTLPVADGTLNQQLTTNGAGAVSWSSSGTGSVTSVSGSGGTSGLTLSGGPITTTGTLTLGGTLAIANGGTGQTNANNALNALLPSQGGNSGKFLTTDATNASWAAAVAGTGTATRVAFWSASGTISSDSTFEFLSNRGLTIVDHVNRRNVFIGSGAGAAGISGTENVAMGDLSLSAVTSGGSNIAIGQSAGYVISSSSENVIIGDNAGTGLTTSVAGNNVFLGHQAGQTPTTGGENTLLGAGSNTSAGSTAQATAIGRNTTSGAGGIAIGYGANAAANQLALPDAVTTFKFQGDSYTLPTAFPASNDQALISSTTGAMTWGSVVTSGFYTPTLTNVTNLTASTVYDATYTRIGNVVTVAGRVEIDPTTPASLTELGISLPIASNIAGLEGVCGTAAASGIAGQCAAIIGDATNNRAQMTWIAGDITNQSMYYTYQYYII